MCTCVQLQTSASISSEKGGVIIDRHEREEFREKNMEGDMENWFRKSKLFIICGRNKITNAFRSCT